MSLVFVRGKVVLLDNIKKMATATPAQLTTVLNVLIVPLASSALKGRA